RAAHPVFGYNTIPAEWNEAYVNWWKTRHEFTMEAEWLIFTTGVIPALSTSVRRLTAPAEKVLINSPVYNIFYNSIVNNGRTVLDSPLVYDGEHFDIDFEDLESKLADPQCTLYILCNPHNPVGRIWTKEELARIGELCKIHHVTVVSDEIHCDITAPGKSYTPFAAASEVCKEISVTAIAPTKAFNIAGLHTAAVMVPDENLRHKIWRSLNNDEVAEANAFAIDACVAAFTLGAEWLDAKRAYVQENKEYVRAYIREQIPEITVPQSEATYLLWLDCTKLTDDSAAFAEEIRKKTGLYLSNGAQYGGTGKRFLRMNLACPRSYVEDGMQRLKKVVR
ncbi:MAG: PatB family C-S lyase, partial [Lachnospiraceae bacterium]|nr:PatB family C-S lyase [Lachnospiraceae bacterium]